ncbi:decarboxylating 6-phosphogluconate dehydrogenase [Ornithinimicrobium sp. F0845]|uniref:phosphogluconate dehydrogenase (NAD(+)-dependent, decarboxylating) n=1 Tax=Ornithinimicrobium sp. F0845 TaxID=2926412 RepID=UPI001FF658BA|nr:decarboxylating 6-phosphogluconate dehydrogenase [Ornithinimicrobium sp. F0845]MCK0113474.1 decarboxylating 6-phosphogluconate dehydrogenase [Ornithinimicrobium sp. F0845]
MQLGMIGLGKMGANMRDRLRKGGHEVVGYDLNPEVRDVDSLQALVEALDAPRVVWVMVPHGAPTQSTVDELGELLSEGDLVIEGGNSHFTDDVKHHEQLATKGIGYVDCGVSGGIWGITEGYGLMCGGETEWVQKALPIFDTLRPEGPREEGWVHAGDVGAGHYAKMVHNGIEYGLMHAYAEGFELLTAKDAVKDVKGVFQAWTRGTVVRSWLLDLLVRSLDETPGLEGISEYTSDSGEGRWTLIEGIEHAVPMPVLSAALFARFASRQENSPAMQAVAALRGQFGGHAVKMLDEEAEQIHPGAEPKHDEGAARPGAGSEAPGGESAEAEAAEAGPTSGSGETDGTPSPQDGPSSGSGSTDSDERG